LLVPYIALAKGNSAYLTQALTEHLQTNIWVAERILNTKFNIVRAGRLFKLEKVT